jgi:hypothetical protein
MSPAVEESWTIRLDEPKRRLFIIAKGYATESKSADAAKLFITALGSRSVDVIVDLGQMTGYTSGARQAWQMSMYSVRSQMLRMIVIGERVPKLVRMGATVVAAFIGVPIRFHSTLADFDDAERTGR